MIHVATVHHRSARWIDIQLAYLRRHIGEPYRVVANLDRVPGQHEHKFDRVVPARGGHAGKLNLLAAEIVTESEPDDLIMFLDGDAFPIADPMPSVHKALAETMLLAVRREENGEDKQPHPSFCVIRVGDWDGIRGDWSMGYCWESQWGEMVSDSGGNLLAALERAGAAWTPITRTNRVNPHPLWFGVYGDIVYHHGAGFRKPVARSIATRGPRRWEVGERLPWVGTAIRKLDSARLVAWEEREMAASRRLGDEIFAQLQDDPEFFRQFL